MRRAEPADADAIARVQTEGWQRGYAGLLPEDYLAGLSLGDARRRWRSQLAHADRRTEELVAEQYGPDGTGHGICGILVVGPSADPDAPRKGSVGELFAIYVDAHRWSRGVGYALHQRGVAALVARGFEQATLWMLPDNVRAGAFYTRQGWVPDHLRKTDDRGAVRLVEVRLRRPLTAADLALTPTDTSATDTAQG